MLLAAATARNSIVSADYLVVGGGIVGMAVAWRLTQKLPATATIVLVDRQPWWGSE